MKFPLSNWQTLRSQARFLRLQSSARILGGVGGAWPEIEVYQDILAGNLSAEPIHFCRGRRTAGLAPGAGGRRGGHPSPWPTKKYKKCFSVRPSLRPSVRVRPSCPPSDSPRPIRCPRLHSPIDRWHRARDYKCHRGKYLSMKMVSESRNLRPPP